MGKAEDKVLRSEGARKLLEGGEELSDDERALLLALIGVEAEAGRELNEEEQAAVDRLEAQVADYNVEELAQAVKHMVTAESREEQKLEWPELKGKLPKGHSPER